MKNTSLLILFILLSIQSSFSQGEKRPIIFSGFLVESENADPIKGAHIYIPRAGHGTSSSEDGFFAMPVYPSDSIIISSVAYNKQFYIIPEDKTDSYSVVIEMTEQTTSLPVVEVFPYPTEELFKEALLALELPDEEKIQALRDNLNQKIVTRLALTMGMDGNMNYDYYMKQSAISAGNRFFNPTLQLLNPFAWREFIQSVKRGDFKRGKWKKRD